MGLKTSVCSPKRLCGGINIFLISEKALSELSLSTFRTAAVWLGLIQGLFCIWSGAFTKPKTVVSLSVSLGKTPLSVIIVVFLFPNFYGTVIDTTAICKWKVWTKSERTIVFVCLFVVRVNFLQFTSLCKSRRLERKCKKQPSCAQTVHSVAGVYEWSANTVAGP